MKFQLHIIALSALMGLTIYSTPSQAQWKPAPVSLKTKWAAQVSPQNSLPDYPRPQMVRSKWQSLNGLWSFGLNHFGSMFAPGDMNGQILVPFPYESSLSGIGQPSPVTQKLWYKRTFTIPKAWKSQSVLLHFGAVNYESTVTLNGRALGSHKGGFDSFDFDITSQLRDGENELVVSVLNPIKTDVADAQVVGKQRTKPGGIFYTGATGIWQSVWLEPVPVAHIDSLKITPDVDTSQLRLTVNSSGNAPISVSALDGGKTIASVKGTANTELIIPIKNAKLWSPDSPTLYDLKVTLGTGKNADSVNSYFAMRKISLGKDDQGRTRIFLNNKFVFQVGALDQGYWPDGIWTAPTDDALKYDIQIAKTLGWNMLRKHAKVEPARWYYWTDKLGMLVWQDMPQMYGGPQGALSDAAKNQFDTEWRTILSQKHNSPSIVVWTTFNEGWGQHDTPRVVAYTKALDPSRLVNNASGWTDQNVGDIHDTHAYPGPWSNEPEATRAAVNGEFGGITMSVPDHRWQNNAGVMGYGATLKSGWLATKRYQNLLETAYKLKETRGTSAIVYTQITDVEQEINGLLTYDRAVMKPDVKIIAAANRGEFLPLPPNPNPELVPTSDDEASNWKYTTDKPADDWFGAAFNDTDWKTGAAPFGHDAGGIRTQWTTSDIWIRRTFDLPTQIPAKLNLLVKHDEDAEIYVNGVLAGTATGYTGDYVPISMSDAARATLKPGQNTLAVHVHQTTGGQGIDVGIAAAK
ncbi:beta-galactosidase [Abditibacteriota bacterium]|nr:beta-galactosidase [Abditibacteriota bacterium]